MSYLEKLNDAQKRAVLHKNGPLLIIAGAGAGKTRVLVHRILHLIKEGVAPQEILAVTFTNKAAREMRERVETLIHEDEELNLPVSREALRAPLPFVSTFHSLGVHIIKEHARLLELTRHFSIYDRNDSIRAVKDAMKERGIDQKQFEPRRILGIISREKGDGISYPLYEESVGNDFTRKTVATVWEAYERILKKDRALDFDDLLLKAVWLLEAHEDIKVKYHGIWKYLLIDEYQDTNKVQYRLSELLAGPQKNVCVVGDIDQNIYSWRGADIQNLLDFEKTYENTTTILLEENYRSTQNILNASNAIIKKNKNRIEKTLFTQHHEGEKISVQGGYDEEAEAQYVVEHVASLLNRGVERREIAILYRTNFQSRVLEEAFLYAGIPYQVLGTRFFERAEVKDVLSYLRASQNEESSADIKRIIDTPPRGIGKVTLMRMVSGKVDECTPAVRKRVDDFKSLLLRINEYGKTNTPSQTIAYIIKETGLEAHFLKGTEDDTERLGNIRELVTLATKYNDYSPEEGIEKLLEDAALASDQDTLIKNNDAVKLMTVHASKGLEFDYVFITGLEEGLFPQQSTDDRDTEEERRLFYVALTRARKKVFLTFASVRTIFGSREVRIPSEFISDIPDEYLEGDSESQEETNEYLIL